MLALPAPRPSVTDEQKRADGIAAQYSLAGNWWCCQAMLRHSSSLTPKKESSHDGTRAAD